MTENDNAAIARAIYAAYAKKDRASAERLIADKFRFTSPLDNAIDRRKYFEICWPNSERIQNFELTDVVAAGERVFVSYEVQTLGGRFRNAEILTVRDGRIVAVEVYFGWDIPHEVRPGEHIDDKH